jgi:Ca2+-binding EF-hand superfamily protein
MRAPTVKPLLKEIQVFFRSITLAAVAASALSTAAWSQAAQAPAAQQAPPTRAAISQNISARFAELDTNKDGSLTTPEIASAQTQALQRATQVQQQRVEAEFKRLDTNKNNQLSLAEFRAAIGNPRTSETPAQMIAQLDTNKDGKISSAEYAAPPLANFDRFDTNRDGTLSAQEAEALRR